MRYVRLLAGSIIALGLSCGQVGPEGPAGPTGPEGKQGPPASATDCPEDYTRDMTAAGIILCKKGIDEVVKVGRGGSAFWIDRHEASIWERDDGTGRQFGAAADDYPQNFPKNGQWTTALYAISKANVKPSAYLTWFQANTACRASGKRLPVTDEWFEAARGTADPQMASRGDSGTCVTGGGATGPRNTAGGTNCVSTWGVQDMIGNLYEWTGEWYPGIGTVPMGGSSLTRPWPQDGYNGDSTRNVSSGAIAGTPSPPVGTPGMPAAGMRGGNWTSGTDAGIFDFYAAYGPAASSVGTGFRCVVPR